MATLRFNSKCWKCGPLDHSSNHNLFSLIFFLFLSLSLSHTHTHLDKDTLAKRIHSLFLCYFVTASLYKSAAAAAVVVVVVVVSFIRVPFVSCCEPSTTQVVKKSRSYSITSAVALFFLLLSLSLSLSLHSVKALRHKFQFKQVSLHPVSIDVCQCEVM